MQLYFSDTTTKKGQIQGMEIELFGENGYGKISNFPNRMFQATRRLNDRLDKFAILELTADGKWQIGDTNYTTDFAIATHDITSGVRDYTFDTDMLQIEKVVLTDSAGIKHILDPMDIQDSSDVARQYLENASSNVGTPVAYDKFESSLILQPTPNFTRTGALEVFFKRGPYYFVYTDSTNRSAGIPSLFHEYLYLGAALDWAIANTMPKKIALLQPKVDAMEARIVEFYAKRRKDERKKMKAAYQNNK